MYGVFLLSAGGKALKIDLSALNESQKQAVLDTEGAVLVFAGAGSGKTRVLTYRVANLVEKGVPSWQILAVTFTNKAAREMRERLNNMLGDHEVFVSTFHSFCAKVLFSHAEKLAYGQNFSILDESASTRMIKRVLRELHLDDREKDDIKAHISTAKNADLSPDSYYEEIKKTVKNAQDIRESYIRYNELLQENNSMDFDDLQTKTLELFRKFDDVRQKYAARFKYIHVDEFQDTNNVQLELIKLLSSYWKNIFVVGDDDQSIYSWRGANVQNILGFQDIFENVKTHKLEQNYRSTGNILQAANNLIQNNIGRQKKVLYTQGIGGVRVEYQVCYNEHQEAKWVIDNIKNLMYYNGYKASDFAILTRINALSRLFEMKLRDLGVNYNVLGGFRFFDRQEILDLIAYLKTLCNPADSDAILRIMNFPNRGIGDTTQQKLLDFATQNKIRMFDLIMDISRYTELPNAIRAKAEKFKEVVDNLLSAKVEMPLDKFVEYLVEYTGIEKLYMDSDKEEDFNRLANIKEFIAFIKDICKKEPGILMEEFLQSISLETEKTTDGEDKLTIATMHSAKGLEFRVVFVVGCEEGILPSDRSLREGALEEERRVMYVALTRAKERLYISSAVRRTSYGGQSKGPSRFFYEAKGEKERSIDERAERTERLNDYRDNYGVGDYNYVGESRAQKSIAATKPVLQFATEKKVYNTNVDSFEKGARISHPKYGEGIIIDISGDGAGKTATVLFKALGMKKFALANAPLKLL